MKVEQVTFTGFKSLHDLTLPLGDLTVITGPNGAGKSNLLAGLGFIGDVYRVGLDEAMQSAGGFDRVAYRREQTVPDVKFRLQATLGTDEVRSILDAAANDGISVADPGSLRIDHEFSIQGDDVGGVTSYRPGGGKVRVRDAEGRPWPVLPVGEDAGGQRAAPARPVEHWDRETWGLLPEHQRGTRAAMAFVRLLDSMWSSSSFEVAVGADRMEQKNEVFSVLAAIPLFLGLSHATRESMGGVRVFQLSPPACRRPGVPGPNVLLGGSGENLPAAADHLRQDDPEAWNSALEAMSLVAPGLTGIEVVPTENRSLSLRFHERGLTRPWTSDEVSDGMIKFFALVVALYDRRVPLLAVEEPENALHPWIMREFVKLCRDETGKQVVLTTHSPALIDYVPGELVHLMWREDGKSRIGRMIDLDPDVRKIWESGEVGLFDMYDAGVIRQATPGF